MQFYNPLYALLAQITEDTAFTYESFQTHLIQTDDPSSGMYDLNALLRREPCWLTAKELSAPKEKKTIILIPERNSKLSGFWSEFSEFSQESFLECFSAAAQILCDLKFQVYCPNLAGDQLICLNNTSTFVHLRCLVEYDSMAADDQVAWKDKKKLLQLAYQQEGVSADQILLLDGEFFATLPILCNIKEAEHDDMNFSCLINQLAYIPPRLNYLLEMQEELREGIRDTEENWIAANSREDEFKVDNFRAVYHISSKALVAIPRKQFEIELNTVLADVLFEGISIEQLCVEGLNMESIDDLPQNLTHLSLSICADSQELALTTILQKIFADSPNLVSLTLTLDQNDDLEQTMDSSTYQENLSNLPAIDLPSHLKYLTIGSKDQKNAKLLKLKNPSSLKSLYLESIVLMIDEEKVENTWLLNALTLINSDIINFNNFYLPHLVYFNWDTIGLENFNFKNMPCVKNMELVIDQVSEKAEGIIHELDNLSLVQFHLTLFNSHYEVDFESLINSLPRSLHELVISIKLPFKLLSKQNYQIKTFPFLLNFKLFNNCRENIADCLLKSMPNLIAFSYGSEQRHTYSNLPSSVQDIEIYGFNDLGEEVLNKLPSILRYFKIQGEEYYDFDGFGSVKDAVIVRIDFKINFNIFLKVIQFESLKALMLNFFYSKDEINLSNIKLFSYFISYIKNNLMNDLNQLSFNNCQELYDRIEPQVRDYFDRKYKKKLSGIDESLDFNPNKKLEAQQIFFPLRGQDVPDPGEYRLLFNCGVDLQKKNIELIHFNFDELNLIPINPISLNWVNWKNCSQNIPEGYGGEYIANLSSKKWFVLPSFGRNQQLTHLFIEGLAPGDFELRWVTYLSCYLIKLKQQRKGKYKIYFVLIDTEEVNDIFAISQEEEVYQLAKYISEFGIGQHEHTLQLKKLKKARDKLDYIWKMKVGSCRHRAILFFYKLYELRDKEYISNDWYSYIVRNGVHMYVELSNIQGQEIIFYRADLGGYPAEIKLLNQDQEEAYLDQIERFVQSGREKKAEKSVDEKISEDNLIAVLNKSSIKKLKDENLGDILEMSRSCLITTSSCEDSEKLCKKINKKIKDYAIYFVNDVQQLMCQRQEFDCQSKEILPSPAGELVSFLKQSGKKILLINYDGFKPKEIAQYNSIYDRFNRRVDNVALSDEVFVIAVQNVFGENAYRGKDFLSRFDEQYSYSFDESPSMDEDMILSNQEDAVQEVVDLYCHINWRKIFAGLFPNVNREIEVEPGVLLRHIDQPLNLCLYNPPLHLSDFKRFLMDVSLKKPVYFCNHWYNTTLWQITVKHGYEYLPAIPLNWSVKLVNSINSLPPDLNIYIVTQTNFYNLFKNVRYCKEQEALYTHDGFLAEKTNQQVFFYVADNLSDHQGAQLLLALLENRVPPCFFLPPGVKLPTTIKIQSQCEVMQYESATLDNRHQLIYTKNLVASLLVLAKEINPNNIISVGECTVSDVSYRLDSDETEFLKFIYRSSEVVDKLLSEETVVLLGPIPKPILNYFMSLWLPKPYLLINGEFVEITGKLIILSDDKNQLTGLPYLDHTESILGINFEPIIYEETLHGEPTDFSEESYLSYQENRKNIFRKALMDSACIILGGDTGVGKSTFLQECADTAECSVFFGIEKLEDWLTYQEQEKPIILFIDESNTYNKDWLMFQDLMNSQGVWHRGKYYALTDKHKVVFAGNLTYNGERNQPKIFEDPRCVTVIFNRIPAVSLYYKVLKPAMNGIDEQFQYKLSQILIDTYQKIVDEKSTATFTAITPRDLECMLAFWVKCMSYENSVSEERGLNLAKQVADLFSHWLGGEELVHDHPASWHRLLDAYVVLPENSEICYVKEHRESLLALKFLLETRMMPQAGLRQLILEGNSGIGKTLLIQEWLKLQGYQELTLTDEEPQLSNQNYYYVLAASMQPNIKKQVLEQAYKQGAIVIIDECNTSLLPESYVNNLLMNKKEGEGERGFFIIGTQNPGSFKGRQKATQAQLRRAIKIICAEYSLESMQKIIAHKYPLLNEQDIQFFANEYIMYMHHIKSENNVTLRNFLENIPKLQLLKLARAETHVESQNRVEEIEDDELMGSPEEKITEARENSQFTTGQQGSFFSLFNSNIIAPTLISLNDDSIRQFENEDYLGQEPLYKRPKTDDTGVLNMFDVDQFFDSSSDEEAEREDMELGKRRRP